MIVKSFLPLKCPDCGKVMDLILFYIKDNVRYFKYYCVRCKKNKNAKIDG